MTEIRNPFVYSSAAQRYSRSRPEFHPIVMERIRARLELLDLLDLAVDVGCGTGQSARALTVLARRVIATDISLEMLAEAEPHPQVTYLHAPAENLPLEGESVDLITASLAFHWFDRSRFLSEVQRVLKPGGTLVVYSNFFTSQMLENPNFLEASNRVYRHFPTPPRHSEPLTAANVVPFGLELMAEERYSNEVKFTLEGLIEYMLTQSNFILPIEDGRKNLLEVHSMLEQELGPCFLSESATFSFEGKVVYLQKL